MDIPTPRKPKQRPAAVVNLGTVYFLADVRDIWTPASEINQLVERKETGHWQGTTVVCSPTADTVINFVKSKLREL